MKFDKVNIIIYAATMGVFRTIFKFLQENRLFLLLNGYYS